MKVAFARAANNAVIVVKADVKRGGDGQILVEWRKQQKKEGGKGGAVLSCAETREDIGW